ncbi:MAG: Crp/Fnr family transcriptional regulator [Alphaproteobacteria bacterium]
MASAIHYAATLRTLTPLGALPDAALNTLLSQAHSHSYPKGQPLFNQGDAVGHVAIILSGWVKLTRTSASGTEAVLDVLSTGHILGLQHFFAGTPHPCHAIVAEDAEILSISATLLPPLLAQHPALTLAFLQTLAQEKNALEQELEGRALQNAAERLGCFLLRLVPPAQHKSTQPIEIKLPFDKTLIAARLGMKPETFSRALASLKKELNLRINGSHITIPRVGVLTKQSCASCSGVFPCYQRNCR